MATQEELIERMARAMEPNHFAIYDDGCPISSNFLAYNKFLNAEKVVKRARKKAMLALAAISDCLIHNVPE